MQKFEVVARVQDSMGATVVAPDGAYMEAFKTVPASAVHTAVGQVVKSMSSRWDKVMQRHYNATPRMGIGDSLTIQVRRVG